MTIGVGLIGAGVMGADHARTLATQVPGAELRIICDADAARAKALAAELEVETASADPLATIADKSIDAVIVAAPDAMHKELILAALAAGKPVLCEKPMAPTPQDCIEIIAAEVKRGKQLIQIGYNRRFDPAYWEMRDTWKTAGLGEAIMFHGFHRNVSAPPWFDSNMAVTNSAVHDFDIARWLLETEIVSVQAFRPALFADGGIGSPVFLVCQAASGQLVNIEVSNNAAYGYDVRGDLVCRNGTVSLLAPVNSELCMNLQRATSYPADWRPRFVNAYRLQLQGWIGSIRKGKPEGASAWDGYAASACAAAGLKSLASGQAEKVELIAKPALYGK
jgi:myo-inositol 2-dehydrogenase / D-chiro-inositol 1-dehydrogenase